MFTAGRIANVRVEAVLRLTRRCSRSATHSLTPKDQVHEDPEHWRHENEQHPQCLGPTRDLVVTKEVPDDNDQEPEVDQEEEELDEPQQHVTVSEICRNHLIRATS